MLRATTLALALIGLWALAATAKEPGLADTPPAEARGLVPYLGVIPACDEASVLAQIQSEFEHRETSFWQSGLVIEGFGEPREIGFRSNGLSYIPRRFCRAQALLNDGHQRNVTYEIAEALGFIGIGHGVTWCVTGLDRNHAFSPACKAAGP
jgi:hypothetical protein